MGSEVFFYPLPLADPAQDGLGVPLRLEEGLSVLVASLVDSRVDTEIFSIEENLGLKTTIGKPGRPATVTPMWHQILADSLAPGKPWAVFDTLSITTGGLDKPGAFLENASLKGFPECRIADDVTMGPGIPGIIPSGSSLQAITCAGGIKQYSGLGVVNPIRPHPHLGFFGMVPTLGLGLVDRQTKLDLHQDVRLKVDTPMCAGCGACLDVCIVDAITFNGGRASIDHDLCTGCAECMDACFMTGIAPGTFTEVASFQKKVAEAAAAVTNAYVGSMACFNFLIHLDRSAGGGNGRKRVPDLGILASFDPVALDQATWDLITFHLGEELAAWSGFTQNPQVMLDRAAEVGLGSLQYVLSKVLPEK